MAANRLLPFQVNEFPTSCPPIDYMMQDSDAVAAAAAAAAANKHCITSSRQSGIVMPDDYVNGKEIDEHIAGIMMKSLICIL